MDPVNIATIIVALIAAAGAWASGREARKASRENTLVGGRVDMEKEAYNRARQFDTETIKRQDEEIAELRVKHEKCDKDIQDLKTSYETQLKEIKRQYETELTLLRLRIARLERIRPSTVQEIAHEREDIDGPDTAIQQPSV